MLEIEGNLKIHFSDFRCRGGENCNRQSRLRDAHHVEPRTLTPPNACIAGGTAGIAYVWRHGGRRRGSDQTPKDNGGRQLCRIASRSGAYARRTTNGASWDCNGARWHCNGAHRNCNGARWICNGAVRYCIAGAQSGNTDQILINPCLKNQHHCRDGGQRSSFGAHRRRIGDRQNSHAAQQYCSGGETCRIFRHQSSPGGHRCTFCRQRCRSGRQHCRCAACRRANFRHRYGPPGHPCRKNLVVAAALFRAADCAIGGL